MKYLSKKVMLVAVGLGLSFQAKAYVTSATLEFNVDHYARIYLNGHLINGDTGQHYPDYAVLSTSDGTLPLEAFVPNGDNLLAIEDIDLDSSTSHLNVSYRLTVHHSSGDPVVIWGLPEETKLLHLSQGQKEPAGWFNPKFDDSKWQQGVKMVYGNNWYTDPELPDPAFGIFGFQGVVPHISYIATGAANPDDMDLCRNHFTFPYSPAKTRLFVNPATARAGQAVAMRLMPGPDAADIGPFMLYADLPQGLDLMSAPGASIFDREKRRVGWNYPSASASVRFLTLTAETVLSSGGWDQPEKVLGGPKPNHPSGWYHPNIPDNLYLDSAAFFPGMQAIFKMQEPDPVTVQHYPVILGVIFHGQMLSGGTNTGTTKDVDDVLLNYSVASDSSPALKKSVWISRVASSNAWYDGYYDATEDRHWTWADIQNLKVIYDANTRRTPDKNRVASSWVVVKCFRPQDTAPVFYARVSEPTCKKLEIQAGIYSSRFTAASTDPVLLPVNQQYCPTPTAIPTVAITIAAEKQATPIVAGLKPGLEVLGLSCMSSSLNPSVSAASSSASA